MKKLCVLILLLLLCLGVSASAEVSDYHTLIDGAINLENYNAPNASDTAVFIYRTEQPDITFDFTVSIADATITLDGSTQYQKLLDLGWSGDMPKNARALNLYDRDCYLPDGSFFNISVINPTKKNFPFVEATLYSITLTSPDSPAFVLNGISFDSTIADVVSVLGEPNEISYFDPSEQLELKYQDANYNSLTLTFDATGALIRVRYSYSYNQLL